jgi:hypothetical protein
MDLYRAKKTSLMIMVFITNIPTKPVHVNKIIENNNFNP